MKYRKKPVEIEAIKWNGENTDEVIEFCGEDNVGFCSFDKPDGNVHLLCQIATLEGAMTVNIGDYIIKGVKGEFYPCKPDIFEMTYEKCEKK